MKHRTPELHPLARTDAPMVEVRSNKVMRAYHADRFEQGATDDLAIEAWSDYMAERQRMLASFRENKDTD